MTWDDLARENYRAARNPLTLGHARACATRCYYAAYCRVTARLLERGVTEFAHGWNNPSHTQLPRMVRANLGLAPMTLREVLDSLELLRLVREDADYRPTSSVDAVLARLLKEASTLLSLL